MDDKPEQREQRQHEAGDRRRRILLAAGDFLAGRNRQPDRRRPAARQDGLFENHQTGARKHD